jgi:hypothetical protein
MKIVYNECIMMMSLKLFHAVFLILLWVWEGDAFLVNSNGNSNNHMSASQSSLAMVMIESRRNWFVRLTAASPLSFLPQQAQARDELFRSNPLTNSVLEQVLYDCTVCNRHMLLLTVFCAFDSDPCELCVQRK